MGSYFPILPMFLSQDSSRLVDICRQTIVFHTLEDLADCLELIITDPETIPVGIKNRFDPSFDSSKSAGYRDGETHILRRLVTPCLFLWLEVLFTQLSYSLFGPRLEPVAWIHMQEV